MPSYHLMGCWPEPKTITLLVCMQPKPWPKAEPVQLGLAAKAPTAQVGPDGRCDIVVAGHAPAWVECAQCMNEACAWRQAHAHGLDAVDEGRRRSGRLSAWEACALTRLTRGCG